MIRCPYCGSFRMQTVKCDGVFTKDHFKMICLDCGKTVNLSGSTITKDLGKPEGKPFPMDATDDCLPEIKEDSKNEKQFDD